MSLSLFRNAITVCCNFTYKSSAIDLRCKTSFENCLPTGSTLPQHQFHLSGVFQTRQSHRFPAGAAKLRDDCLPRLMVDAGGTN